MEKGWWKGGELRVSFTFSLSHTYANTHTPARCLEDVFLACWDDFRLTKQKSGAGRMVLGGDGIVIRCCLFPGVEQAGFSLHARESIWPRLGSHSAARTGQTLL